MILQAHTDGASRGNPGKAGIGVVIRTGEGSPVASISGSIATTTNNQAEYRALLECLNVVAQLPCTKLTVHSDSELMVRQLTGVYKIKDAGLRSAAERVRAILREAPYTFEIKHVRREANADADALANEGIDGGEPVHVQWHDATLKEQSVK